VHSWPFGSHEPQAIPQKVFTSPTHTWSQVFWQQNGSIPQILPTHGSHIGESGGPMTHSGCEQVPTGLHTPALHCPVQHSPLNLQGTPSGRHMNGPHLPSGLHGPVQHGGEPGVQTAPSGWHFSGPQNPFEQMLLQHGALGEHGWPSGLQTGAPQRPLGPQVPVQQSMDVLQGLPSGRHIGFCAQAPLSQIPVQHCEPTLHEAPSGKHAPPHTPALQTPSQQSAAATQLAPGCWHTGEPPNPPWPPEPPTPLVPTPKPRSLRPQLAKTKGRPRSVTRARNSEA
jgi:hypothetical protein